MTATRITAAMCARGRTLVDPRLSPDGEQLAYVSSIGGSTALVVIPASGGPEVIVTTDPAVRRSPGAFAWLPSGRQVAYVAHSGLYLQSLAGGPPRPVASGGALAAPAVAPDGARVAYTVDGRHVAVAELGEDGPWPVRLSAQPDFVMDPHWSADGRTVAWHEWSVPAMAWDDSHIALAGAPWGSGARERRLVARPGPAAVSQPRFSPDGSALAFLCDAGGWLNLWIAGPDGAGARPLVDERLEHGGPTWGPGERTWTWAPDGRSIAVCRNQAGFGLLAVVDVATGTVRDIDRGVFASLSWAGDRLAAVRSGARTPTAIVVYESPTADARRRVAVARGPVAGFEAAGLVEPEQVTWDGEDVDGLGPTVRGRLYRSVHTPPDAPPDVPNPLIVWVHSGPTGQTPVAWHPRSCFFLDRGWNVLQVDPRGSTGWGRAYAQAINGRWGDLDVDDIAAGITAATGRGWGDPTRTVIMGGSSGGLAVLGVLIRYPEMCAAGIDLYGVADLFDLDETTHRYEAHYNDILLGPLPEHATRWRERSPVTHLDRIQAPLLVLHGTDDDTVMLAQSEAVVAGLARRGVAVEHHWYPGEGHGWSKPETVEDELARTESFLNRHVLRGRG